MRRASSSKRSHPSGCGIRVRRRRKHRPKHDEIDAELGRARKLDGVVTRRSAHHLIGLLPRSHQARGSPVNAGATQPARGVGVAIEKKTHAARCAQDEKLRREALNRLFRE